MSQEQFTFNVGAETIAAIKLTATKAPEANVLFLHGAGTSASKERFLLLAEDLLDHGIGSVRFDFSGHGDSSGTLSSSSLAKRTAEAQKALEYVHKPVAVVGSSMGAYTAIQLIKDPAVQTLILLCPAIYTKEAGTTPFTEDFSRIIRQQYSWRDSDALAILEDFTGNLLIVIGDDDAVIPPEVIPLLDQHSPRANTKEIIRLPHCTHNMHQFFAEHPAEKNLVVNAIVRMIT